MSLPLEILGHGLVNGCGRGAAAWRRGPRVEPDPAGRRICRVAPRTLLDRVALQGARRADRFSRLSVLAAWDAAGPEPERGADGLGILLTTSFGPHATTFELLDEILDFGDASVSPTRFSHSVHNAAAAYCAIRLSCRGPACTLADFRRPLQAGLDTAALWLAEGRCREVLVGYTEESSGPMEAILAGGGLPPGIPPFRLSLREEAEYCEGSLFLRVAPAGSGGRPLPAGRFENERGIAGLADFLHDGGSARNNGPARADGPPGRTEEGNGWPDSQGKRS